MYYLCIRLQINISVLFCSVLFMPLSDITEVLQKCLCGVLSNKTWTWTCRTKLLVLDKQSWMPLKSHCKLYNINVVIFNKFEVLWKNATYSHLDHTVVCLNCLLLENKEDRQPSRNFKWTLTESDSLLSTILKIIIPTLKIFSCFNMTTENFC